MSKRSSGSAIGMIPVAILLVVALPAFAQSETEEVDATLLPSASPLATQASPAASMEPGAGRVIELELAEFAITQAGQPVDGLDVIVGETVTFRITNPTTIEHNFAIGPKINMITNNVDALPSVPTFAEGVRELTWTVPENIDELRFGCTVLGHYAYMNGSFTPTE